MTAPLPGVKVLLPLFHFCICTYMRWLQQVKTRWSACAGVAGDVHALRGQLATANGRLAAVDSMAGRVAALRSSLAAITASANWGGDHGTRQPALAPARLRWLRG